MVFFQHHPDGYIMIGPNRIAIADFLRYEPEYTLPAEAIGRRYQPGVQHILTDGTTQSAGPSEWPEGDAYITRGLAGEYDAPTIEPTLEDLKLAKKEEIETARDGAIAAGVVFAGYRWQTDKISRENLMGTLTAAMAGVPLPDDFIWRSEDDQNIPADVAFLAGLSATILANGFIAYQHSWGLKALLEEAKTPTAVAAIHW